MDDLILLEPGAARCPGPSTQDTIRGDTRPLPAYLRAESYQFLGDRNLPFSRYLSPEFFQREIDHMWNRVWQWACREENIPQPGDYYVYDVGPYSILVVRTDSGAIKAYHNSCLHRATEIKPSFSEGSAQELTCPFHGWTWSLDGTFKPLHPCIAWDFPHVDPAKYSLPEVRVATWGGFVFINMDPKAPSFEEYMAPLPSHIASETIAQRYVVAHVQKELNCNWKLTVDSFSEAYHVIETHSDGGSMVYGDLELQYDVFSDHISRVIEPFGKSSPLWGRKVTEQEIVDACQPGGASERLIVKEGQTARSVLAEYYRQTTAAVTGADYSQTSDSEMVDSIQYLLFPNTHLSTGMSVPIVVRTRPLGMDPNRSLLDVLLFQPRPKDGHVETASPVRITHRQSYTEVPGMNNAVGRAFDQDTGNLEMAQRGAMASPKKEATLANYQEIRIRHLHQVLDKYLAG